MRKCECNDIVKEFSWVKKINGVDSQKIRIHGVFSRKSLSRNGMSPQIRNFRQEIKVKVQLFYKEKEFLYQLKLSVAEKVKLKKNQMSWEIRICLWQKESENKNLKINNILRSKNLCVAEKVKVKTKEKKLNVLRNKKLSVAEKHQRALFTLKLHNVLQLSWIARVLLLSQNIRTKFKMLFPFFVATSCVVNLLFMRQFMQLLCKA